MFHLYKQQAESKHRKITNNNQDNDANTFEIYELYWLPSELLEMIAVHLTTQDIGAISEVWPEVAWLVNYCPAELRGYVKMGFDNNNQRVKKEIDPNWYTRPLPDIVLLSAYKPLVILDALAYAAYNRKPHIVQALVSNGAVRSLEPNNMQYRVIRIMQGSGWLMMKSVRTVKDMKAIEDILDILEFSHDNIKMLITYHTCWMDIIYSGFLDVFEYIVFKYKISWASFPSIKLNAIRQQLLGHNFGQCGIGPWYSPRTSARVNAIFQELRANRSTKLKK